ncbi:hypothetical protein H8B06_04170 [Sphingobacterium sp. DN00404]|uniref:Uncharacterized protein n=1 Tax=Sphingobacterium micropteri TaxID=2763501 RepID=A0ABR7YL08_9SPHI|nr:hypothetical protein [Sphingobacterium micropteri]MBD1432011.1 hypothetical protein [Sphingobacterium micropteri]
MNRVIKLCTMLIAWASVWMGGCTPDDFDLGAVDVNPGDLVEGIAFKIEHDAENPNIVYLTSLMDSRYTPLWDHLQGRSQAHKVTLKIPFEGTYEVKFGVQTRGGIVFGELATFTIDNFYAGFVDHELWTLLSGGVGQEKTWYLDLDGEGLSRYFVGPLFFYGMDDSWVTVTEGKTIEGDSWNWKPDYKGNSWLMAAGDYGAMTFSLKDGANVRVDHKMLANRGVETGTYMIDTDNYTMRMNDASPLHNKERDGHVVDWGNIRILSLTENYMQLAVVRDKVLSEEDPCLLVYNFISKDYKDNWVPGDQPDPEPPYEGNANDDLTTSTTTSKKWALSLNTPYNWTNLAGEFLNGWSNPSDYLSTTWASYDADLIRNISLTLDKTGANAGNYVFTDGTNSSITGSYSTDENNNIVFDKVISFTISGGISLSTTDERMLRIITVERDAAGDLSGLWLGRRDPDKPEYQVYKFEPVVGGATTNPLTPWKNALAGKTFMPDVNYFADWVTESWSGGWTSDLFPNDFTTQSWLWTQSVYDACLASSISYYLDGDVLKANAVDNGVTKSGIVVEVDPEARTITYSEAPFTFSFVYTDNNGGKGPWLFGSYDGANLGNVNTKGVYLGFVSKPGEISMNHIKIKE